MKDLCKQVKTNQNMIWQESTMMLNAGRKKFKPKYKEKKGKSLNSKDNNVYKIQK